MNLKRNLSDFLYKCSNKIPSWIFKFNKGIIYFTKTLRIRTRDNKKYYYETAGYNDVEELSEISHFKADHLRLRLEAGDICFITREIETKKIKTILWAHLNNAYVRGFNLQLRFPANSAYFYWGYSTPDVRITGIFNNALSEFVDLLKERKVTKFYSLVEFWNNVANRYHKNLNYDRHISVIYMKILFFKITIQKNLDTNKIKINFNIKQSKNHDII